MTDQTKTDFQLISTRLVNIMQKHVGESIHIRMDKPNETEFIGPPSPLSRGKELWIGAVRIGKSYVSYHLMAVYMFPELLRGISPELKRRMQGKSCFNFTRVDEQLFLELDELTERSFERYKQSGFNG